MNCTECNTPLVNGQCPNAEAHAAVRVAELLTSTRELVTSTQALVAGQAEANERMVATLERLDNRLPGEGEPGEEEDEQTRAERAAARGLNPSDTMRDEYDQRWFDPSRTLDANRRNLRANLELAYMMMSGARQLSRMPLTIEPSERFLQAWRANVLEGNYLQVVTEQVAEEAVQAPAMRRLGHRDGQRAMDTAESGFGAELVGAQYVSELWASARNMDTLYNQIQSIPMSAPTAYVPIDGSLPEMLLVGESTAQDASNYTTSKSGSNRRTLTAKKFTIQEIWSGELNEDSIINYVEFLRQKLAMSAAIHLGSAAYNGDTTNAGTGNINSDDADPADTRHYLAYDGIRHIWLVDAAGQGVNKAAALSGVEDINQVRALLTGSINSVNSLDNITWDNPDDLLLVADRKTYLKMIDFDEVKTVDKLGAQATVITGQLAAVDGVRIVSPAYACLTEADGKLSETASNNTKGQFSILNKRGFLIGNYRPMQLFFDRIQRTDQFLFELYTRVAFTRWGATNVVGGMRNITV